MLRATSPNKEQSTGHMMLMSDSLSDSSLSSDSARKRKSRNNSFFSLPRLLVGLTKNSPDSDPARSPTSPLDCKVFSSLGNYLARSPRSPHCDRVGLGLVDALHDDASTCVRVVSSTTSPRSLPKNYVVSSQTRVGSPLLRPGLPEMAPELHRPRLESRSVYMDWSFLSRQDLNIGSSPGSLPITTTTTFHDVIGSLPASEIEQSEDYTCIISRGPNPKTTHIFGDCVLESHTSGLPYFVTNKQGEEGRGTSWMLTCSEEPVPFFSSEDFLKVCYTCKKKLEGKDIYMYRGEKAFCSCSCRSQEILVEEEMEEPAAGASGSPRSTSCEEIFLLGMDVTA